MSGALYELVQEVQREKITRRAFFLQAMKMGFTVSAALTAIAACDDTHTDNSSAYRKLTGDLSKPTTVTWIPEADLTLNSSSTAYGTLMRAFILWEVTK